MDSSIRVMFGSLPTSDHIWWRIDRTARFMRKRFPWWKYWWLMFTMKDVTIGTAAVYRPYFVAINLAEAELRKKEDSTHDSKTEV